MSPHKAEARLIGTTLVITAVSCLASAVGGLAAAATRGDWIMVATLALVPGPDAVHGLGDRHGLAPLHRPRGPLHRDRHALLKAIETDADSVTLTLTRAGRHYLAECETRPRKG